MSKLAQSLELCNECGVCLEVCPTYKATRNHNFSPIGRIEATKKILQGEEVTPEAIESIYSCPECHLCTGACPIYWEAMGAEELSKNQPFTKPRSG